MKINSIAKETLSVKYTQTTTGMMDNLANDLMTIHTDICWSGWMQGTRQIALYVKEYCKNL